MPKERHSALWIERTGWGEKREIDVDGRKVVFSVPPPPGGSRTVRLRGAGRPLGADWDDLIIHLYPLEEAPPSLKERAELALSRLRRGCTGILRGTTPRPSLSSPHLFRRIAGLTIFAAGILLFFSPLPAGGLLLLVAGAWLLLVPPRTDS